MIGHGDYCTVDKIAVPNSFTGVVRKYVFVAFFVLAVHDVFIAVCTGPGVDIPSTAKGIRYDADVAAIECKHVAHALIINNFVYGGDGFARSALHSAHVKRDYLMTSA